jgi:F-box domain
MAQPNKKKSGYELGDKDRLSDLPDSILHNIMSFMPARHAVRTCVLSKRWKTLWMTLHVLNIALHEFGKMSYGESKSYFAWYKCQQFLTWILLHREPTCHLHTFSFECEQFLKDGWLSMDMSLLIQYVIMHNPRIISINIGTYGTFRLCLEEIFTCPSLEQITLSNCIKATESINLPLLKRLHLKFAHLHRDFVSTILSGCPLLEDLHVEGSVLQFSKIISRSLKYLTIKNCYHNQGPLELINSPSLLSLNFTMCACRCEKEVILNMPSLREACILFDHCCLEAMDMTKSHLLYALFNVTSLELKGLSTQVTIYIERVYCVLSSKCRFYFGLMISYM